MQAYKVIDLRGHAVGQRIVEYSLIYVDGILEARYI